MQSTGSSHGRLTIPKRIDHLLHHNFYPNFDRKIRRLKHPLAVLVLAACVSLPIGVLVNPVVLVAFWSIILVGTLGCVWPWLSMRSMKCQLSFDRSRTGVGEAVGVTLRVTNRWPWALWGLSLRKGFAADMADNTAGVSLARLPRYSVSEFTWEFRPPRRGVYPLELPRLETGFPFGLWTASRLVECDQHLVVWPRVVELRGLPEVAAADSLDDRLSDHRAGDFGDLLGTRDFREGDSLRRVHWSQTARHGRLIVCERQAGAVAAVCVTADLRPASYLGPGIEAQIDMAVSVVGSVCRSLMRQHAQVECWLGQRLFELRSPKDVRQLLDALARVPRAGLSECGRSSDRSADVLELLITGSARAGESGDRRRIRRIIAIYGRSPPAAVRPWIQLGDGRLDNLAEQWKRSCREC